MIGEKAAEMIAGERGTKLAELVGELGASHHQASVPPEY
jgi:hypothetical protein